MSSKIWLEANTERSESNPGRSLGILDVKRMAVWKTVPPTERSIRVNPINPCSKKNWDVKRTRIERIQRILSEVLLDIGFTTDCICAYTARDASSKR